MVLQISHFMHVAVFEEDRRFYARSWDSYDNIRNFRTNASGDAYSTQQYGTYHDDVSPEEPLASENGMVLSDLLEVCSETLQQGRPYTTTAAAMHTANDRNHGKANPSHTRAANNSAHKSKHSKHHTTPGVHTHGTHTRTHAHTHSPTTPHTTYTSASRADSDQHDLFFIFLVEVLYSTLVSQLRTLVQQVVTNHQHLPAKCRTNYTEYLRARQLVGNVSGTGLSRLSWGSTIYEEEEGMGTMDLQSADSSESEDICNKVTQSSDNISAPIYTNHSRQTSGTNTTISSSAHSSGVTGSSDIGNYLLSLSQMPWLLSPAPTPAREEHASTKSSVDNGCTNRDGVEKEGTVHSKASTSNDTHRSSGRADYSFPISSSSSTHDTSSNSIDNSLLYSNSSSNKDNNPVSAKSGSTVRTGAMDAGMQYLDALQTPPADQYGRRMQSLINTSDTAISTMSHPVAQSSKLGIHNLAPATPISRTSQPHSVSVSNSSTTSNLSTTSIISSASKYTGRYGPRRTPGRTPARAAYNIVTPARSSATPAATPSGALVKSTVDKDCAPDKELAEGGMHSRALPAPILGTTVNTADIHTSSVKKNAGHSTSVLGSSGTGKRRKKASKNSVRHRQKLIIKYITSVKVIYHF